MFNVDTQNRVWVGAIQGTTPRLTRFGIRADLVHVDELFLMPANEYYTQIPKGYIGAHIRDHYYDASVFINQIPTIKEFRAKVLGDGRDGRRGNIPTEPPLPDTTPGAQIIARADNEVKTNPLNDKQVAKALSLERSIAEDLGFLPKGSAKPENLSSRVANKIDPRQRIMRNILKDIFSIGRYNEGQITTTILQTTATKRDKLNTALVLGQGKGGASVVSEYIEAKTKWFGLHNLLGRTFRGEIIVPEEQSAKNYLDDIFVQDLLNKGLINIKVFRAPGTGLSSDSQGKHIYSPLLDVTSEYGIKYNPNTKIEIRLLDATAISHREMGRKYKFSGYEIDWKERIDTRRVDDFSVILGRPSLEISEAGVYGATPELQSRYDATADFLVSLVQKLIQAKNEGRIRFINPVDQELNKETPFSLVIDKMSSGETLKSVYNEIKDTPAWQDIAKVIKERYKLEGEAAFNRFCDGAVAEASRHKFGQDVYSRYESKEPESYGPLNYNVASGMDSNARNKGTHHGDVLVSAGLSVKAALEYAAKHNGQMPQG
jgi:hypothetical protein